MPSESPRGLQPTTGRKPRSKCSKDMPGGEEQRCRVRCLALLPLLSLRKRGIFGHTSLHAYSRRASAMPKADVSSLNGVINHEKIAAGVRMILEGLGENLEREGLRDTAERVARRYVELLQGLHEDPRDHVTVVFDEQHDELVLLKDVPFSSLCAHPPLPFLCTVHGA